MQDDIISLKHRGDQLRCYDINTNVYLIYKCDAPN